MMKFFFLFFTLTLNLFAATYEVNKDHSHITYKIPYMTYSDSEGSFSEYSAKIDFDADKKQLQNIEAKVLMASINTQDKKRDAHLRSRDFFDVEKYPFMTFSSESVQKVSDKVFDALGTLEVKGVKQKITLRTQFKGKAKDHTGKESLFFKASSKFNRKDFGIVWNKSLDKNEYLIGDEVTIDITIQAQPIGRKTAFSTHMIPANEALENYAKYKRGEGEKVEYKVSPVINHPSEKPVSIQPNVLTATKDTEVFFPWWKMVAGFLGFCFLIVISYFVKLKIIQYFKLTNYSESGIHSLIADAVIIGLTFLYAIWFFKVLYP